MHIPKSRIGSKIVLMISALLFIFSSAIFAGKIQTKKTQQRVYWRHKPITKQYPFFKNEVSVGYYNKSDMNVKFPHPPSPIFWEASTKVDHGVMLMYQHLAYHTLKHFAMYLGVSTARWTRASQAIYTFSFFVAFKFFLLRTRSFNPYIIYSIAGPTGISSRTFGPAHLGEYFLFQDMLGIGALFGEKQAFNVEFIIVHYSNGDLFTQNNGFGVPILLVGGYSFTT